MNRCFRHVERRAKEGRRGWLGLTLSTSHRALWRHMTRTLPRQSCILRTAVPMVDGMATFFHRRKPGEDAPTVVTGLPAVSCTYDGTNYRNPVILCTIYGCSLISDRVRARRGEGQRGKSVGTGRAVRSGPPGTEDTGSGMGVAIP